MVLSGEHGVPVFDNQVWANPAPSLEQLHLEYMRINGHGRFSGVCPSLHSLYLKYCTFGWHTLPIVPSITELSIILPIVQVRIDDIMKILQVVGPSLKKLQLWDVINETQSIPAHSSDRYEFPELDSFWLRETDAGLIAPLLSRISLPHSLEALHISARRSDWVTSGLVQALVSSRNLEKWPLDYLLVAYEDPVVVLRVIEDWSEDSSDDEDSDDEDSNERDGNEEDGGEGGGNMVNDEDDGDDGDGGDEGNDENDSDDDLETNHRHVELEIRMANDASSIIPVLEQLQVPIEPIKSVYFLSTFGSVQDQTILEYFGNLGTIQVLTITETFFPTLVEFLMVQVAKLQAIDILKAEGHDNPLGAGLDIDHISFLNLDTLQIRDSNNQGYETLTPNNFLVLQEWLTWRKRYGLPSLDLSISGVVVRLPSIGTLTELFGDLVSNLELEDVKPEGDIV
ncbi:hypothetical protein BDN72DRAFT_590044 [Pluteus cervinus]|uniref:Uncharacterized protein n=1 Tax=Pluteus cervinus TaxID=181527 RepID=A0ACD3AWL6_9AGAR|nr:hypothetical protein BDN72DRAFT_590044 [Pluteus cervinus]